MNAIRRIGGAAARARLALAPVHRQRTVEVAALAVDVDVERVEGRAAGAHRLAQHVADVAEQLQHLPPGQRPAQPLAVQFRPPQRLVGVDVADPRDQGLVEQGALDRRVAPPQPRDEQRVVEVAGPSGRARCGRPRTAPTPPAGRRPAPACPRSTPPKVRWSTKRSSRPPSVKPIRTCRCFSSGRVRRLRRATGRSCRGGRRAPRRSRRRRTAATRGTCRAGTPPRPGRRPGGRRDPARRPGAGARPGRDVPRRTRSSVRRPSGPGRRGRSRPRAAQAGCAASSGADAARLLRCVRR